MDIWDACEIVGTPYGPIVRLMMLTLTKEADVVGMAVKELVLDQRTNTSLWTIPSERSRTGSAMAVPLTPMATSIVLSALGRRTNEGLIFGNRKRRKLTGLSSRKALLDEWINVSRYLQPALDWKLGDIRRTFAVVMEVDQGFSRQEINLCLDLKLPSKSHGNSSVSDLGTRRQVLEAWGSLLESWLIAHSSLPEWRARRTDGA